MLLWGHGRNVTYVARDLLLHRSVVPCQDRIRLQGFVYTTLRPFHGMNGRRFCDLDVLIPPSLPIQKKFLDRGELVFHRGELTPRKHDSFNCACHYDLISCLVTMIL